MSPQRERSPLELVLLVWVALFGVWPLADPGHDDWTSPMVWLDIFLHVHASVLLLRWYIDSEVKKRLKGRT